MNRINKKKKAGFSILFFWFCFLLICPSAYAKDKVTLDLIGRWRNTYSINCIEILQNNAHSYAYCGATGGLLILDVTDPQSVKENAFLKIGSVIDIAFYNSDYDSHKYAVLVTGQGICILYLHDPTGPTFAGRYDTWDARCITISSDEMYAFVADIYNDLVILHIIYTSHPQGNLLLCPGGPSADKNPLWAPSQCLLNMAYFSFLKQNYTQYFTYHLNPDPSQDIDGDGTYDPLVVDDFIPTKEDFHNTLTDCDDLIDPNTLPYSRTIITCTDEGYFCLDQTGLQSLTGQLFTLIQDANQIDPGLFEDTGISFYERVRLLQSLFSKARETFWSQGHPLSTQPPQMVTDQSTRTLYKITLSPNPILSIIHNPNINQSPDLNPDLPCPDLDHPCLGGVTGHIPIGEHQERAMLVYEPGLENYVEFAQKILEKRRIPPESIDLLQGPEALIFALDKLISSPPESLERLFIYYICQGELILDLETLFHKLDKIQDDTNCTAILLVDADFSGTLLPQLSRQNRIIITSTDTSHHSHTPRFSHFFFSSIYNGVNIDKAFRIARHATKCFSLQSPLLDDNADGRATESGDNEDGRLAKRVYIGSPFQHVPSGPTITTPSVVYIRGWETNIETIWAEVQDPNSLLRAHIQPPEGDPNWVSLSYDPHKERFEVLYPGFTQPGIYTVTIYAQDKEGLLDFDQSRYIMLMQDAYEPDDTPGQARPIAVNNQPQYHSFHDPNDSDWVYFYAYPRRAYTITAWMRDEGYHARIRIYDIQKNLIDDASESTIFFAQQNGYYLLRVSYTYSSLPNVYSDYDLSVVCPFGLSGGLYGYVKDKDTGKGIPGASVCVISDPFSIDGNHPCRTSMEEWWSNDPKDSIGYMEAGFFFFPFGLLIEGIHRISAQAQGYTSKEYDILIEENSFIEKTFYLERVDPNIPSPDIDPNVISMTLGEIALKRKMVKGVKVTLYPGLNLFSYPLDYPFPYYAGEFLNTHDPGYYINGPQWFSGIRCYDKNTGRENTCYFALSNQDTWSIKSSDPNNPLGFPISYKEGYIFYMNQEKTLSFAFPPPNPAITLKEGINWIGIPNPPPGYTSQIMLKEIGTPEEVVSISGYNPLTGEWESTYWKFGKPGGENFPISTGQGYKVFMKKKKDWLPGEQF